MGTDNKSYRQLKSTVVSMLFYLIIFIVTIALFKYCQAKLTYEVVDMPIGPATSYFETTIEMALNFFMILLFFRLIIYSSLFNIFASKKLGIKSTGQILIVIELILIILTNVYLFISDFYSFDVIYKEEKLLGAIGLKETTFLDYHIFFIGELTLFISILVGAILEFFELGRILKIFNTGVLILLSLFLGFLLVYQELILSLGAISLILTLILLYAERESKLIKQVRTILLFAFYCIVNIIMLLITYNFSLEIESLTIMSAIAWGIYVGIICYLIILERLKKIKN